MEDGGHGRELLVHQGRAYAAQDRHRQLDTGQSGTSAMPNEAYRHSLGTSAMPIETMIVLAPKHTDS